MFEVEVHVYAFSMAANVLLSFFPFLIVIVSLFRYAFEWKEAEDVIFLMLQDQFPGEMGKFIQRNLRATVASRGPFQFVSVVLLFYAANGIFLPLEVALNRAWGIVKNRSYVKNQLISLLLIFACGGLALASAILAALNRELWLSTPAAASNWATITTVTMFRLAMAPMSILVLVLIYWVLPNGRVPVRPIIPVAVVVGIALEMLKYLNVLTWPWLRAKLEAEYGPFVYSVTIVLWGFLAALVVLAGAEWAARRREQPALQSEGEVDRLGVEDPLQPHS
jgi:YihY family inner membrane protein